MRRGLAPAMLAACLSCASYKIQDSPISLRFLKQYDIAMEETVAIQLRERIGIADWDRNPHWKRVSPAIHRPILEKARELCSALATERGGAQVEQGPGTFLEVKCEGGRTARIDLESADLSIRSILAELNSQFKRVFGSRYWEIAPPR